MVDILGTVFRQFSPQQLCGSGSNSPLCSPESGALLVGEENLSRSLLFLSALTAASEFGVKVLYFTQSQIQSLPLSVQGGRKADSLKKIRFVYPKTLEELLEDVASLHELVTVTGSLPSLLIVDGLEQYVCGPATQDRTPQEAQSAAAHVMALLHDTAAFLTQKLGARAANQNQSEVQNQCKIIVSYQPEWKGQGGYDPSAGDPFLSVLERYLQVRCTSEKVRRAEGSDEWLLCLSGPGLDKDGNTEEQLQWRVVMQPNGMLGFYPVNPAKEDTPQGHKPVELKND